MSLPSNPTGPGALAVLLSGVTSVGLTPQTGPLSALGGLPSSTFVDSLTPSRPAALPGIWIAHVSGSNGAGVGTLSVVSDTQMAWAAPGEAEGDPVTVAAGDIKILFSSTPSKYVIVQRRTVSTFRGSEAVGLVWTFNNWLGGSNFDSAEATAGASKYLALFFANAATAGDITNLKVWVDGTQAGLVEIGKEAPVDGAIQLIADEDTAPTGVTFSAPTTSGTALSIGTLTPGDSYGLWRKRYIVAATDASPMTKARIYYSYTFNSVNYTGEICGANRVANDSLIGYELHVADGADPDPDGTPVQSGASLPLTYTASFAGGEHRAITVKRNAWGLASEEIPQSIWIDATGEEYTAPPSAPNSTQLEPGAGGICRATVLYQPNAEGLTLAAIRAQRANKWAVYATFDGTDPDPDVDTPVMVDMETTDPDTASEALVRQREILFYETAASLENTPVKMIVRTARDNGVDPVVYSTNTTIYTATARITGPQRPRGFATLDSAYGQAQPRTTGASGTFWIDEPNNIRIEYGPGDVSLYGDTTLAWRCIWRGRDNADTKCYVPSEWDYINASVSGAGTTDPIEVASWGVTHVLYVCVNGVRRVKIDFDAMEITFASYTDGAIAPVEYQEPVLGRFDDTIFLIYDETIEQYQTYLAVDDAGVLFRDAPWDQTLPQVDVEAL